MRFGLRLIGYLGTNREIIELARAAEAAGFDSVWFPHDTFMHNTWVLTTAAAEATDRIEIGTVGLNPYTTDPSEIATYAATLDDLSSGRFILGLGVHTDKMIEWTGIDATDHIGKTTEAIAMVRALLAGEVVTGGEHFDWTDQCYLRMPVLRADLPIYAGGFGPDYLEAGAAVADGSLPMITPPESAPQMVAPIERGVGRGIRTRDRFTISGCAWLSLSESRAEATDVMRQMVAYFGPYLEDHALRAIGLTAEQMAPLGRMIADGDDAGAREAVTDDMIRLGLAGTPNDIIERIAWLAEAGIDEVNLGGPLGPDPRAAIELMGAAVIPHFRS